MVLRAAFDTVFKKQHSERKGKRMKGRIYCKVLSMLIAVIVLLSSCAFAPEENGSVGEQNDKSGVRGSEAAASSTGETTEEETTEELTESGTIGFRRRVDGIIAGSPWDYDIIFHVDDVTVTSTDLLDKESTLDEDFYNKYVDSAAWSYPNEDGVEFSFTVAGPKEGELVFWFESGKVISYGGHRTLFTPFIDFDMNGLAVGEAYEKQLELLGEATPEASLNKHQRRWRKIAAEQNDSTEDYYVFENGEYLVVKSYNDVVYDIALIYND